MSEIKKVYGVIDQPILKRKNDRLKLLSSSKALKKFIEFTDTPMTIGIQGSWGTGKTSLLNMIKREIEEDENSNLYKQIYINAWEHSILSIPEESLFKIVNDILSQIAPKDSKIKEASKKLLTQATRLGVAATMGRAVSGIADEMLISADSTIRELKNQLSEVISKDKSYAKLIVYIDDLDRINPPDAVAILELLKNVFDLPQCIFVLAIDYDVVVKGLRSKYNEQSSDNEYEYRAFFDKIIQLPFQMPTGQYSIGDYVSQLMEEINFFSEDDLNKKDLREIEFIVKNTIQENPRSLKRLINYLSLIKILHEDKNSNINSKDEKMLLFAILCLQIAFPDIYSVLERDPNFREWDKNVAFKHTQLKEEEDGEDGSGKEKFLNQLKAAESRESIIYDDDSEGENYEKVKLFDEEWEKALFRIAYIKPPIRKKVENISRFLNYLYESFLFVDSQELKEDPNLANIKFSLFTEILNVSQVTSVTSQDLISEKKPGTVHFFNDVNDYFNDLKAHDNFNKSFNTESEELLKYFDEKMQEVFASQFEDETILRFISPSRGVSYNCKQQKNGKFLNIDGDKHDKEDKLILKEVDKESILNNYSYYLNISLLKKSSNYRDNCMKKLNMHPFQTKYPITGEFYSLRLYTKQHIDNLFNSKIIEDALNARISYQGHSQKDIKAGKTGTIAKVRWSSKKTSKELDRIISKDLLSFYEKLEV